MRNDTFTVCPEKGQKVTIRHQQSETAIWKVKVTKKRITLEVAPRK